jgi:glucosylceramidase
MLLLLLLLLLLFISREVKVRAFLRQVINHWVSGWIDWNLALNTVGGPTYLNNNLDAAIIVNATANEFYKQPIFYALAHMSKFVPPGSKRIQLSSTADSGIDNVAFLRPDGIVAVVLLNR